MQLRQGTTSLNLKFESVDQLTSHGTVLISHGKREPLFWEYGCKHLRACGLHRVQAYWVCCTLTYITLAYVVLNSLYDTVKLQQN